MIPHQEVASEPKFISPSVWSLVVESLKSLQAIIPSSDISDHLSPRQTPVYFFADSDVGFFDKKAQKSPPNIRTDTQDNQLLTLALSAQRPTPATTPTSRRIPQVQKTAASIRSGRAPLPGSFQIGSRIPSLVAA
uniref:Uncharacterized protein n=1 Tax=Steinernema glaseri TaxID=37863 RepID=A0A1I7YTY8_9BILA